MLTRTVLRLLDRQRIAGGGSLNVASTVHVNPNAAPTTPAWLKDKFRLERQRHMQREAALAASSTSATAAVRTRRYVLCKRCGAASVLVNFDQVPSARVGMFGRCANEGDYTHHRFSTITAEEYQRLQSVPRAERVSSFLFSEEA
jgi:hypothetical protein